MRPILTFACIATSILAATNDSPTGARITPPTISAVSPQGVQRGATVEMTIEGLEHHNAEDRNRQYSRKT